ncbi:TrmH family RNA methyltransferase [Azospirillum halopraeferens]|uniref:TrmH family RNA methyltransferase n=1 Tax=Azospirillum halopraeferens TaxID=34010 RepID=UPI00040342DB|nr:RNA methyltransferase [Azospirillum halopraeferens]
MPRPRDIKRPRRKPPDRTAPSTGPAAGPPAAPRLFRVAGFGAVSALFENEPQRVERLFFDERLKPRVGPLCEWLARARRPYRLVDGEELARIAGTAMHGGVVALMAPRPVPLFDPAQAAAAARDGRPLLLLDGVGNPHNLGAIVRTAAFFGLPRLVLSDHPARALPSEAGYRVAEGGFEWVEVLRAEGFAAVLRRLSAAYRVVGTALDPRARPLADLPPPDARDPRPLAVVLGNEEEGLPRATLAACEAVVTLPGSGRVQSLNVAATAAIVIHHLMGGRAG